MSDAVLTDVRDSVLVITLNRPDAVNAIDTDMARGLLDAVQRLDSEPGLAAGVLTGAGRGFCSRPGPKGVRRQRSAEGPGAVPQGRVEQAPDRGNRGSGPGGGTGD